MRQNSWIALAIVFLVVFFAANNTTQSGVKPDWWVNSVFIAQRSGGNFIAGGGTTIVGVDDIGNDRVNITITATATGVSNAFTTIDTPSGTDPVADSATDTLQLLVTGADFSVTGSAAADSVTFDILTHAGTDITADLEEEGQINATAVTGNAADDQVLLGTAASAAAWTIVVNCADTAGNHLNYTQATNTFSCGTSTSGLTQAYTTVQDEGVSLTQRFTLNFIGTGISCVDNAGSARTDCTVSAGGTFSGEVDDTTNDALTFTTDDPSPPATTVRSIYGANGADLRYTVPGTGSHVFSVGGTGAATIDYDRWTMPQNPGPVANVLEGEQWYDTNLNRPFFREDNFSAYPIPARRRFVFWTAAAGGTSITMIGDSITTVGAVSSVGLDDDGNMVNWATGAVSGNDGGIQMLTLHRRNFNPITHVRFKLQETASMRMFCGFTDQTLAVMVGSDDPAGNYAGLQYSTPRGDTNFQWATKDNVTQNLTNSGVAATTNAQLITIYLDEIIDQVVFQYNDNVQVVTGTNIPSTSTSMRLACGIETEEAVTKNIRIGIIEFISDR